MPNSNFIKPGYGGACFADLPATIKNLLTGSAAPALAPALFEAWPQRYDTVLLFFIDSFGWRFFEKYRDRYPFLQSISAGGRVAKLTAQFPSTTAAHVTCIHTGLAVAQSGLCEWYYYEPELDAVIAPLLFSYAGTKQRDTLQPSGISAAQLYPAATIYRELQQQGVAAHIFQSVDYAHSVYSKYILREANIVSYSTLSEALVNLGQLLARQQTPAYYCLYFDKLDGICHRYGPNSPQVAAEIDTLLTTLDRLFLQKLAGKLKNTLFMLIADHGQITVDPQTAIYLNLEPRFAGLTGFLRTNRAGQLIVPGGSSRDMFLYVKAERLAEAQAFLGERLAGRAEVWPRQALIDQGFFGAEPPGPAFLARMGNLIILPYANETVWWYEEGKFAQEYQGMHGGLSPQEMEIPLLLFNLA